jgi:PAS domain S-box-containing protein
MNVLIVDDMAENVFLLETLLEGKGYKVTSARNGKEAMKRLQEGSFDLIISDILMPVMDGFRLCRECKTNPEWREIPFVFYTATYTEKRDEEFALALGADRFVVKPQEPEKFLEIIKRVLDLPHVTAKINKEPLVMDEKAYLATHSERVIRKLEKRTTELAKLNLALSESEKKYRLLADNVEDVIFVLDMNLNYVYVSPSVKTLRGYEPAEVLEQPASKALTPASWDLAVRTVSEEMERDKAGHGDFHRSRAIELEMWRKDGITVWTEAKVSFIRDEQNRPTGIIGVTRDITERKCSDKALAMSLEKLRKALGGTVQAIAMVVEARDPYTAGHQRRVADLAHAIAGEMDLEGGRIECLRMAATIHDIGKISVPAEILSKPAKLTHLEFGLIKIHPQAGYDILQGIEFPWPVAQVILQHHEKMDGSGYPEGLKGEEILLEARVLAVADVVEAMATHRPYRPALGIDVAMKDIERNRGILYDTNAVNACLRLFRENRYQLQ